MGRFVVALERLMGLVLVAFGPLLAQHVDGFAFLKDILPQPTE